MRLVIIECGKRKIWDRYPDTGPTAATNVYIGTYSRSLRQCAEQLGHDWLILSAKYGFIQPSFVIPGPYNVTFMDPSTHPISTQDLRRQVAEQGLGRYDRVTVLGGRVYAEKVREGFAGTKARIEAPLAGRSMGDQMHMAKLGCGGADVQGARQQVVHMTHRPGQSPVARSQPDATGIPTADDFRRALRERLSSGDGAYVDVNAGELHDLVGTRSGKDSRMPTCCNVMLAAMRNGDTVLASPPKGRGATLMIRYLLPR